MIEPRSVRVQGPRYPDARSPTVPADNGLVHYGAGLKGSLCGVEHPDRAETRGTMTGVTCPNCRSFWGRKR